MIVYKVHLQDEIPAIGSGVHFVTVRMMGWKWVRIVRPHRINCIKIRRSLWDSLDAVEHCVK